MDQIETADAPTAAKPRSRGLDVGMLDHTMQIRLQLPILMILLAPSSIIAREAGTTSPAFLSAPFDEAAAKKKQDEWAAHLKREIVTTNASGIKLVLIPPGSFIMGGAETIDELKKDFPYLEKRLSTIKLLRPLLESERPQHKVRITRPFYVGTFNVTLDQFRDFVRATAYQTEAETDQKGGWGYDSYNKGKPFEQKPEYNWRKTGLGQQGDHPVVNVSWNDAVAFCDWLSKKEGKVYRLPSEAEWEYSCRAGATTRYNNGADPESLAKVGNIADASLAKKLGVPVGNGASIQADDGYAFTAPVGKFLPNAFGLFDMHGNAGSWCSDWFATDYYSKSPAEDPKGPTAGSFRVFRGEGWHDNTVGCRSAKRDFDRPSSRSCFWGFRVVHEL